MGVGRVESSRSRLTAAIVTGLLALTPLAGMAQDADPLARELIALRAEVEQLNAELNLVREEQRTAMAGLSAQKAELAAQLERQELARKKLRDELARRQNEAAEAGVSGEALQAPVLEALDLLARQVQEGLPFKREERLAALEEIRTQIQNQSLPPPRAVNRIWAFMEDEFRATRENGLFQQTITLDGESVLADVGRIGTMMLFFRLSDGRMGKAERGPAGWTFVLSTDEAERQRIASLLDSLKKQIRQGWFELPNALAQGGVR